MGARPRPSYADPVHAAVVRVELYLRESRSLKAKRAVILKELAAAGIPADVASAFRCPIGLDLGTNQPGEIAISVVAQFIQERDRWRGGI